MFKCDVLQKKNSPIKHVQKHVIVIDDSLDIPKFKKKI